MGDPNSQRPARAGTLPSGRRQAACPRSPAGLVQREGQSGAAREGSIHASQLLWSGRADNEEAQGRGREIVRVLAHACGAYFTFSERCQEQQPGGCSSSPTSSRPESAQEHCCSSVTRLVTNPSSARNLTHSPPMMFSSVAFQPVPLAPIGSLSSPHTVPVCSTYSSH